MEKPPRILSATRLLMTAVTASLGILLPSTPAHAANIITTWDNSAGDWFDPTKWSSGIPLNASDLYLAIINAGTVTLSNSATTSGISLAAPATLTLNPNLTLADLPSFTGNSSLAGTLILQTNSFFDTFDNLTLSNATISGPGTFRQLAQSLTLTGSSSIANFVLSNAPLNGPGTLTITNHADISGNSLIDTVTTFLVPSGASATIGNTLTNNGTISSAGSITLGLVNNTGVITGAVKITGNGTSSGLLSGDSLEGARTLQIISDLTLTNGARISSTAGTVNAAGRLTILGEVSADHLVFTNLTGAGTLHLSGPNNWVSGPSDLNNLHITTTGSLSLTGIVSFGTAVAPAAILLNEGVIDGSENGTLFSLGNRALVDNRGTLILPSDSITGGALTQIVNSGLISGGTSFHSITAPLYNLGTVLGNGKTLTISGGGSSSGLFTATSPSAVIFLSNRFSSSTPGYLLDNATLSGPGLFGGTVQLSHVNTVTNARFSQIAGGGSLLISGTLTPFTQLTVGGSPSPTLFIGSGAQVTLLPTGSISNPSVQKNIITLGNIFGTATLINQATVSQFSGTLILDGNPSSTFDNQGNLTVSAFLIQSSNIRRGIIKNSGLLNAAGSVTLSPFIYFQNTGTLTASGPSKLSIPSGGTSSGTFATVGGATIEFGTLQNPAPMQLDGATLLGTGFLGAVSLHHVNAAESVGFYSIFGDGTLTVSQSISFPGEITGLTPQSIVLGAKVVLLPGSSSTLGLGPQWQTLNSGGQLINRGVLNLAQPISGRLLFFGSDFSPEGGILNNQGTITNAIPFNAAANFDVAFVASNTINSFVNSGLISLSLQSDSAGSITIFPAFYNTGTLSLTQSSPNGTTGQLIIASGGSASGLMQASATGGILFASNYTLNNATLLGNISVPVVFPSFEPTLYLLGNNTAVGARLARLNGPGTLTASGVTFTHLDFGNSGGVVVSGNQVAPVFYGNSDTACVFANLAILSNSVENISFFHGIAGAGLTILAGETAAWGNNQTNSEVIERIKIFDTAQIINNGSFYTYLPALTVLQGHLLPTTLGGTITNTGTFGRSNLTPNDPTFNTTTLQVPFHNSGLVDIQQGKIDFAGGYFHDNASASISADFKFAPATGLYFSGGNYDFGDSPFDLGPGGLFGTGTVHANFITSGTVSPGNSPGALTINGDLTLQPTSILDLDLWFNATGNSFDLLTIHGHFIAAGTLALHIQGTPDNTPLNLILADNFSGAFDNITDGSRLTDANGIASYLVSYSPTGITLSNPTPVPEPLSLTLLTPTLLPLLLRRRPTSRHPHP